MGDAPPAAAPARARRSPAFSSGICTALQAQGREARVKVKKRQGQGTDFFTHLPYILTGTNPHMWQQCKLGLLLNKIFETK